MAREFKYYLYKITCTIPDKPYYYYGIHKTKNVNDRYFGSGTKLLDCVKGLGIENFKREILEFFPNYELLAKAEKEIVGDLFKTDPWCLNLKAGGENAECSEALKLKQSQAMKKRWQNSEYKERVTKKIREVKSQPEVKKRHLDSLHTREYREILAEITKKNWIENPERKEVSSQRMKERYENPEEREIQSQRMKAIMNEPSRHSKLMERFSSEDFSKHQSENARDQWNDPEIRQKHIAIRNSSEYKEKIFRKLQCPYCEMMISRNNMNKHIRANHK